MRLSSPTARLLVGLAVTLAAVGIFSLYALRQVEGLKDLQTRTVDRNRKDSLQLLRIQNDLHSLGLAMRDMLDNDEPYPLEAWKGQFDRTRADLEDALRMEAQLAPAARDPTRQRYLANSFAQFWTTAEQMFALARSRPPEARSLIRNSLQAQQASLTSAVARLLVENNETEEQAMARIQDIYHGVERNIYYFLAAMLVAISLTSLYLIQSNRRLFDHLAALSNQKSDLARKLITVQEEALRSISRELHDEFGQILTAMGAMLRRAEKRGLPPDSPFRADLQEVREVAQATLEKVRSLSQALHPAILDDGGLEKAVDWYLPVFEKQTGITVRYQKEGRSPAVPDRIAVNVYRVLQEALNNLARHSGSSTAWVRIGFRPESLDLEVEDHGAGLPAGQPVRAGIGMVAMRERAELMHGRIEFLRPAEGGTLVRLSVPLAEPDHHED
ncbi:MAG TPA: histidine kinase [Bryobacteraceae bacterium]|nr:histidine kinase [Bryobacteraceae bacterium]